MGVKLAETIASNLLAPAASLGAALYGIRDGWKARSTNKSNAQEGSQVVREIDEQFPGMQSTVGPSTAKMVKAAKLNITGSSANIGAALANGAAAAGELALNSYEFAKGAVTNSKVIHGAMTRATYGVAVVANGVNTYVQGKAWFKARKEARQATSSAQKAFSEERAKDQGIQAAASGLQVAGAIGSLVTGNPLPALVTTVVGSVASVASSYFSNKKQEEIQQKHPTDLPLQLTNIHLHPSSQHLVQNVARAAALSVSSHSPTPTSPLASPLPRAPTSPSILSQSQDNEFTSLTDTGTAQPRLVSPPLDPINEQEPDNEIVRIDPKENPIEVESDSESSSDDEEVAAQASLTSSDQKAGRKVVDDGSGIGE
jgi:hypothetical protein